MTECGSVEEVFRRSASDVDDVNLLDDKVDDVSVGQTTVSDWSAIAKYGAVTA